MVSGRDLHRRPHTIIPKLGIMMPIMGTSLGDALFGATQQRVLSLLFGQPNRSFFANEIIQSTGAGSGAVQRQLKRLEESGLVTTRRIGNQKHFQANPDAPIYAELCGIVEKTFGLATPLRIALQPFSREIRVAFVYGSVAKRTDTAASDIDIMIVSDTLSYPDFIKAITAAEERLGRKVNPTIYSNEEFARRATGGSSFLTRVMSQPKIWLIGNEHDLPA